MPLRYAVLAILLFCMCAGAEASVRRYYEGHYAFYARQSSELSMDSIRSMQRIEARRRAAYAKVGETRIAAGRASTDFAISPGFSVAAHLLELATDAPAADSWVPIIRAEAEPARRQYLAQLAEMGLRADNFVHCMTFLFAKNVEILAGSTMPRDFIDQQAAELETTFRIDPVFQGMPDLEKQTRTESLGVQTLYAMRQLALGKAGDGAAGATARQIAEGILTTLMGAAPTSAQIAALVQGKVPPLSGSNAPDAEPNNPGVGPIGQEIAGARLTYRYNTDLAVARNVAVESLEKFSTQYAQGLLDQFYERLAARGGQRNDLADVAALLIFANYFVVSDAQELTPRQYAGVREMFRQRVLASESIQQSVDADIQFQTEKEIIQVAHNYTSFVRDRAVLTRGVGGEQWLGQHDRVSAAVFAQRKVAMSALDVLFYPDEFRAFRLTADGFVR